MEVNNSDTTLLASAARTVAVDTADQSNIRGRGLHLVIDVTVDPASASITPTIQGKDVVSGKYYTILVGSAIAATGTTILRVYPGCIASANLIANDVLPKTWRLSMAVADGDSITYSIGASLII